MIGKHVACQTQLMSRATQMLEERRAAGNYNESPLGMSNCNASIHRPQLGSLVTLLRPDSKPAHFVYQRGPWDSHPCCGTVRSTEHPPCFAQDLHDMLALRVVQRIACPCCA